MVSYPNGKETGPYWLLFM